MLPRYQFEGISTHGVVAILNLHRHEDLVETVVDVFAVTTRSRVQRSVRQCKRLMNLILDQRHNCNSTRLSSATLVWPPMQLIPHYVQYDATLV